MEKVAALDTHLKKTQGTVMLMDGTIVKLGFTEKLTKGRRTRRRLSRLSQENLSTLYGLFGRMRENFMLME